MKLLIDIKDSKAAFFMEIIKNFSFITKATPISSQKAELMEEIREAVIELNLVKAGKLQARDAQDLINEL